MIDPSIQDLAIPSFDPSAYSYSPFGAETPPAQMNGLQNSQNSSQLDLSLPERFPESWFMTYEQAHDYEPPPGSRFTDFSSVDWSTFNLDPNSNGYNSSQSNSPYLTQQGPYISARASVSGKEETKVLPSELMSTPPAPTKSKLLTQNTSLKRCTPSTQSLGHTSLVQAQLSRFSTSEKVSNHHEPVALSRCSTAESRYSSPSRRPSVPLTPRSLPRNRAEAHADIVPEAEPKQLVEDAIYDFYVRSDNEERKLPPLPIPSGDHLLKDGFSRTEDIFSPRGHFRSDRPYTLRAVSDRREVLAQEHSQSLEDTVHPLVALIQDHAVQQYSQTADLGHQIASLRNDVLTMSTELRVVINDQKPDSGLRQVLEGLCSRIEKSLTSDTPDVLQQLGTKIDLVQSSIAQFSDNPKLIPEVILPEMTTLRNLGKFSEKEQDTKMLIRKIDEKIDRIHQDIKIPSNENAQLEPTALSDMKADVVSRLTELISLVKDAQDKKEGTKAMVMQVENTEVRSLRLLSHEISLIFSGLISRWN